MKLHRQKTIMRWLALKALTAAVVILAMVVPGCAREQERAAPVRIPRPLVHIDPSDGIGIDLPRAILVDKKRQRLILYTYNGHWRETAQWPCSTGRNEGPKQVEGDGKTPEGIYHATRNVTQPYIAARYGSRALPLDYPSWIDRRRRRGGSAIWLHGTDRPLVANNSNGCVVLQNEHIDQVAQYIELRQTPIIIVGRLTWWTEQKAQSTARKILSAVEQWQTAMMQGSYIQFSRWYSTDSRPGMRWWQRWCRQRKTHAGIATRPVSIMRKRSLYRSNDAFVMTFDHLLAVQSQEVRVGQRKLYLNLDNGRVRIVGDSYQHNSVQKKDPLFAAWQKLWKRVDQHREFATSGQTNSET
jgi:murein L,D-transpeptidase YafK